MKHGVWILLVGLSATAWAGPDDDATDMIDELPQWDESGPKQPRFAFSNDDAQWTGQMSGVQPNFMASAVEIDKLLTGSSKDNSVIWFGADVKGVPQQGDCAPGPCPPNKEPPLHTTGLLERDGKEWRWVAWHIAKPVSSKDQQAIDKQGTLPEALPKAVTGADDVVKVFEGSLADGKSLAATVSTRKEVVLYGSAKGERVVGGSKVKATLAKWNLKLTVRDGIQAGVTTNKQVAYLAANVDAVSAKKPGDKASPYRILAVYEKQGTWKLVQLHFSVDTFTYKK
jgi:hypothetical protein